VPAGRFSTNTSATVQLLWKGACSINKSKEIHELVSQMAE